MYQYILFDLDGTISDPKEGITKSVQYALADQGIQENNLDNLIHFIGPPLKDSFMETYGMDEEQAHIAIEKYRERFRVTGMYENELYEGIPELLKRLKDSGRIIAIASSKPTVFVEKILEYFKISEYFQVILGSELDGRRSKKEEVVEEVLHRLFNGKEIDREKTVMIGDRKFDVEGAKEFGIDSIGVEYGFAGKNELKEAGATHMVKTVKQLERLLFSNDMKKKEKNPVKDNKQEPVSVVKKVFDILFPIVLYYLSASVFIKIAIYALIIVLTKVGASGIAWYETNQTVIEVVVNGIAMLVGFLTVQRIFLEEVSLGGKPNYLKLRMLWSSYISSGLEYQKKNGKQIAWIIILGGSSAVALNTLAPIVGLSFYSESYETVAAAQYSVPYVVGLLLYGVISPLAEEALFRGITYNRLKRYIPKVMAILLSAFVFGAYHGNLVQWIYGGIMGLLLTLVYEWTGSFSSAVILHSAANIVVFTVTNMGELAINKNNMFLGGINCLVFGTISVLSFWKLWKTKKS